MCVAMVGAYADENVVAIDNRQPVISQPSRPPEQHNHQDEPTGPQPNTIGASQVSTSATRSGKAMFTTPGWPFKDTSLILK
jgi:hypothetical protein